MSQYLYEIKFYDQLKIFKAREPFNKRPFPENTEEFWKFFIKWGSRGYPHCNFNLQSSSILSFFNALRKEEFEKLKKYITAFDFIGVQDEMYKSMLTLNKKFKFPLIKFNKD